MAKHSHPPLLSSVLGFLSDDSGAITVDWTVVGAAVVGLGLASAGAVRSGVVDLGIDIDTSLSGATVGSLGTLGGTGWSFTPLFTNEAGIQNLILQLVNWNYTQDQYRSVYNSWVRAAELYIERGDSRYAGLYTDVLYALTQAMDQQGMTPPPGATTVEDLHRRVTAL